MRERRNVRRDELGSIGRMPEAARAALHLGWIDGQNRPLRWSREYEAMPESHQLLYEFGRMAVRNVIAAGLPVPIWRGGLEDAEPMHRALTTAAIIAGDPWPRKRDG